jgi:hypothetical protein
MDGTGFGLGTNITSVVVAATVSEPVIYSVTVDGCEVHVPAEFLLNQGTDTILPDALQVSPPEPIT